MADSRRWRTTDPLFRGDDAASVRPPTPAADASVVRHILYLEGPGRETPYLSVTEDLDTAARFAQPGGLWQTSVTQARHVGVAHLSNKELLQLLKGPGKGLANWPDPFEVMQARRYVEQWSEHLMDFRQVSDPAATVASMFVKS